MKQRLSFTLIEILVVATIIGLLAGIGAVSYSNFTKQSRDAKRIADLEDIRMAFEMYRSNNNYYPNDSEVDTTSCSGASGISDVSNTYLETMPKDPKCPDYQYYYNALPDGCDNSTTSCSSYTLGAQLEAGSSCSSPPGGNSCGAGNPCNYCLGPYGKK